jgi:SAM-dependent methyltransferase
MSYRADLYDIVTPDSVRGDVDWYRRKAAEYGGPVLELGAGTGRITLALAEDGFDVHALDVSRSMLDRLREKLALRDAAVRSRLHLHEGDMRSFDLGAQFRLVIVPYRAFLHNLTESDQRACLARVRQHLEPGGTLAFNVFHPSLEFMARNAGTLAGVWRLAATHDLPDGRLVVRSDSIAFDTVRRLVDAYHRYDEYTADGVLTRSTLHHLELAYLYPQDRRRLLADTCFRDVQIHGGFDERPFANDGDELVVEAN